MKRLIAACGVALTVAACTDGSGTSKSLSPIPAKTVKLMAEKGMSKDDPILVRVYKKESELEVWKRRDGQYALLKTFPICRWSGQLGPKTREGDRQAPEGFYTVTPAQMNPNSSFYLSFDTGYPNSFDRAHNRSGSHLMVHGDCSSRGCYAMTDEGISEVYALAREAFGGGQRGFQLQAYPFRMTAENLARYRQDPNMPFWKQLKQGNDHFEVTKREPKVAVCAGRYAFDTVGQGCTPDPTLTPAVAQKDDDDRRQVADLVSKGTPAVRLVYADGGGHESFRSAVPTTVSPDAGSAFALLDSRPSRNLGQVSRPDALAAGPREVPMESGPPAKAGPAKAATVLASLNKPGRDAERSDAVETAGIPVASANATKERRTVLASADPDAGLPAIAAAEPEKPFYERMLGRIPGAPSGTKTAPAVAEPAPSPAPNRRASAAAPKAVKPSAVPKAEPAPSAALKPKTTGAIPHPAAVAKSTANSATAARTASAGLVAGAAPVGPSPTGFARN